MYQNLPDLKAALELLTSRFEVQGEQPASRKLRTYTEKQSFGVVAPQERKELSQMILRPLSRNIAGHPRIFYIYYSRKVRKIGSKEEPKYNIRGERKLKKIYTIALLIILVLIAGCTQNNNTDISAETKKGITDVNNETPILIEMEAFEIAKEGSFKFNIVYNYGHGIPNNTFEHAGEQVEINGQYYIYLGSSLDTLEEFNAYLDNLFTDKSIEAIKETLGIIVYNDKLLGFNIDAGNQLSWGYVEIVSINQDGDVAKVDIKVPFIGDETVYYDKSIAYKYIHNKGWLIDTESPFDLY